MSAGGDEGFIARWSRRKREVVEAERPLAPQVPPAEELPAALEEQAAAAPEPEMVEPPSLDLIDKDFDLAHWLKQNVPESWKLAALRRAWLTDPTIRNFENPARDYALDWNTPGGAPGYGPLTESDDVAAMVRQIFGDSPEPEPAPTASNVAMATSDSMPHQLSSKLEPGAIDAALQQSGDVPAPEPVRLTEGNLPEGGKPPGGPVKSGGAAFAAVQENSARQDRPVRIRKRGGGAIPV